MSILESVGRIFIWCFCLGWAAIAVIGAISVVSAIYEANPVLAIGAIAALIIAHEL